MANLLLDLRLALRRLLHSPGFSLSVLIVLALGIGANTANFSVTNAVLLRPLPFDDPDRLVHLYRTEPRRGLDTLRFSLPVFLELEEQSRVFSDLGAYFYTSRNLTGGDGEAETLTVGRLTTDLLPLLGAEPALGRVFDRDEGQPGADQVVLLSDGLWRRRFAADPGVVGRTLELDGLAHTVVGVMAPEFNFPYGEVKLWTPVARDLATFGADAESFQPVGRLAPGVSLEQARSELGALFDRVKPGYPSLPADTAIRVVPLRQALVFFYDTVRMMMILSLVAHLFVLGIICANVANLLLARTAARQRELALRAALGARRGRLVRQLLTEGGALALAAAGAGTVLAYGLTRLMAGILPEGLYRVGTIGLDASALAFSLLLTLVTVVLFALAPALTASRVHLTESLKEGGGGSSGDRRGGRLRAALIVAQVATAVVLLVGTVLMVRTFERMRYVETGFDPSQVLTLELKLSQAQYPDDPATTAYWDRLLAEVQALPGVTSAATVMPLPLNFQANERRFRIPGRESATADERLHAREHLVSPGYFRAMDIPLLAGRDLRDGGYPEGGLEVVVNRAFAEAWWPGASAVGRSLELLELGEEPVTATVAGIAADTKNFLLSEKTEQILYLPQSARPQRRSFLVVHTEGPPLAAAADVRRAVRAVGAGVPVTNLRPMEQVVGGSMQPWQIAAAVLAGLASLALLLAGIGIYGLVAYAVRQRQHEIGVRMALGAGRGQIASLTLRQGGRLAVVGLAIGLAASAALTHLLRSVLFGVGALDPLAFLGAALLLALAVVTASVLPSWRAAHLDPMRALRLE